MSHSEQRFAFVAFLSVLAIRMNGEHTGPKIPVVWDDAAVSDLELPLAHAPASPKHVSAEYYYRMQVRPIYRSYPVYAAGREPTGYFDGLLQREPEIVFDSAKLKTPADWIRAGEMVFEAPISYDVIYSTEQVRRTEWYQRTRTKVLPDGTVPYFRYFIRQKGKVEVGNLSCASCHTRVFPNGLVVKGAQGDFPFSRAIATGLREAPHVMKAVFVSSWAAPWLRREVVGKLDQIGLEDGIAALEAIPPGIQPRQGTSFVHPVQVPDLIGIKDRKYLDHTGLQRHRNIGDLMRYAAINQGLDALAHFGDFIPSDLAGTGKLPDPATRNRYSDEQLYALGVYLYSLQPPANPNKWDKLGVQGKKVFQAQGCSTCHTPPLYTNNKVVPVPGFVVPGGHKSQYDILTIEIGTDPGLALSTRRGTGYYKVPSLLGVWYRGPFEHSGSVATLEDWFDPARLREDYLPTGFQGYKVKQRAVPGHKFGLDLSSEDKRALIIFLKTL